MMTSVFSSIIVGVKPQKVQIEVDSRRGIPGIKIIGIPSKAIQEARERIKSAFINSGEKIPAKKFIVNLSPADLPKNSCNFDFAIAVALAKNIGLISLSEERDMFLGELSLDGKIKKIRGLLPIIHFARKQGFKNIYFPEENILEICKIEGVSLFPIKHLKDFFNSAKNFTILKKYSPRLTANKIELETNNSKKIFFEQIIGQSFSKRALEIAVAGGHHLLMVGSSGIGKTMLAKSIKSILPALSSSEKQDVDCLHSQIDSQESFNPEFFGLDRPFRSPHHSISVSNLIGGGNPIRPGEIALAHQGVLLLDEISEFRSICLNSLRQPLEDHQITISHRGQTIIYPCSFIMIATSNPCYCGNYQIPNKICTCSNSMLKKFQNKIPKPLIDRFDMSIKVGEVKVDELLNFTEIKDFGETKKSRARIAIARQMQKNRYNHNLDLLNCQLNTDMIKKYCFIDKQDRNFLAQASQKLSLSARAYFKLLKISRTIADLDQSETIKKTHLLEAISLRMK